MSGKGKSEFVCDDDDKNDDDDDKNGCDGGFNGDDRKSRGLKGDDSFDGDFYEMMFQLTRIRNKELNDLRRMLNELKTDHQKEDLTFKGSTGRVEVENNSISREISLLGDKKKKYLKKLKDSGISYNEEDFEPIWNDKLKTEKSQKRTSQVSNIHIESTTMKSLDSNTRNSPVYKKKIENTNDIVKNSKQKPVSHKAYIDLERDVIESTGTNNTKKPLSEHNKESQIKVKSGWNKKAISASDKSNSTKKKKPPKKPIDLLNIELLDVCDGENEESADNCGFTTPKELKDVEQQSKQVENSTKETKKRKQETTGSLVETSTPKRKKLKSFPDYFENDLKNKTHKNLKSEDEFHSSRTGRNNNTVVGIRDEDLRTDSQIHKEHLTHHDFETIEDYNRYLEENYPNMRYIANLETKEYEYVYENNESTFTRKEDRKKRKTPIFMKTRTSLGGSPKKVKPLLEKEENPDLKKIIKKVTNFEKEKPKNLIKFRGSNDSIKAFSEEDRIGKFKKKSSQPIKYEEIERLKNIREEDREFINDAVDIDLTSGNQDEKIQPSTYKPTVRIHNKSKKVNRNIFINTGSHEDPISIGDSKIPGTLNEKDHNNIFEKEKKNGGNFKYKEVVRKKDERLRMEGHACEQCREFYDAIKDNLRTGEDASHFVNKCSRHRSKFSPDPDTPEHFWDLNATLESPNKDENVTEKNKNNMERERKDVLKKNEKKQNQDLKELSGFSLSPSF